MNNDNEVKSISQAPRRPMKHKNAVSRSNTYDVLQTRAKPIATAVDPSVSNQSSRPNKPKLLNNQPSTKLNSTTTASKSLVPRAPGRSIKYEPSERIKRLAQPKLRKPEVDVSKTAFSVKPSSLKYVATDRMLKLAMPRKL